MATVVKKCDCVGNPKDCSEYQNKKYGVGMRIMNLDIKKTAATCTVCGKEHKV